MKRFESKNVAAIKAAAAAKLGRPLTTSEDFRGLILKDSRTSLEKTSRRQVVPAVAETWADRERAKLARDKAEARRQRLPQNERLLSVLDEIASREPNLPGVENPRLEQILTIRDKIRFNPDRQQSALDFATLCLDQHDAGNDPNVASELFEELLEQERSYIDGLKVDRLTRQAALLAEIAELDDAAASLPADSNRLRLLAAAAFRGRAPASAADDVAAAEADPTLAPSVLAKYSTQIAAYEAAVQSGEVQ